MLGLPPTTEVRRQLPKKAIFAKFELKPSQRDSFDADVSRLDIVNWISPKTVPAIAEGTEVKEFYVVEVALKRKDFNERNIELIAKLIPQRILFALHYENDIQLAIYHTKLFVSKWQSEDHIYNLLSNNYSLDQLWENIVATIGEVVIEQGNTLNEQIAVDEQRAKIEKEIASLKRQMKATNQSKRKAELYDQIKKIEKKLKNNIHG
jgi:hypothetical protein